MLRCIRCGACMNHCPVYHGGRRPRLWLGLSRADGRGADTGAGRHRKVRHTCRMPRRFAGAARRSARCASRCRACCATGASASSSATLPRQRCAAAWRCGAGSPNARRFTGLLTNLRRARLLAMAGRLTGAGSAGCRLPPAGPAIATSRHRKARRSRRSGTCAEADDEQPRQPSMPSIRRALGVSGNEIERHAAVAARLSEHPRGVIPQRGQLPASSGSRCSAGWWRPPPEPRRKSTRPRRSRARSPPSCARIICRRRSAMGPIRGWCACPGRKTATLSVALGPADGRIPSASPMPLVRSAKSGTLMLLSGPDNPTTLNFLPDTHVVIVDAADIAGDYEALWQRLRQQFGPGVAAAHGQPHYRPVAFGRYRADADPGRARATAAACDRGRVRSVLCRGTLSQPRTLILAITDHERFGMDPARDEADASRENPQA